MFYFETVQQVSTDMQDGTRPLLRPCPVLNLLELLPCILIYFLKGVLLT